MSMLFNDEGIRDLSVRFTECSTVVNSSYKDVKTLSDTLSSSWEGAGFSDVAAALGAVCQCMLQIEEYIDDLAFYAENATGTMSLADSMQACSISNRLVM